MAISTRLAILTELVNRVGQITIENGFATNAGLTVLFGESPMLGEDDPPSAVALIIGDDQAQDQSGDDTLTSLPIDIQALAKAEVKQPWRTVEAVIADIRMAIERGDRTIGGLVTRPLARGRTRRLQREPGATTIGAAVQYTAFFLDTWGEA